MAARGRTITHFGEGQYADMELSYSAGESLVSLGHRYGVAPATIRAHLQRHGRREFRGRRRLGPDHPQWKGGRSIDRGYVQVWVARDDPMAVMANGAGRVAEHRLVVARALGRALSAREHVHHKNGVRHDNRLSNLQLRTHHGSGVALECGDCGSLNVLAVEV